MGNIEQLVVKLPVTGMLFVFALGYRRNFDAGQVSRAAIVGVLAQPQVR